MVVVIAVLHLLLPLLYFVLWVGYIWQFWTDDPTAHRVCARLAVVTVVLHLGGMIVKSLAFGRLPMGAPLEFMSALALALLVTYLFIEKRTHDMNTGFLVTGAAFLLVLLANLFGHPVSEASPLLQDPGFAGHAILILLAYTALSLSFLYAVLYLILARQLLHRHFGLLFRRLPSLDVLERMSIGMLELGVPLLFLSLCSGHLWMVNLAHQVDSETAVQLKHYDPKILMAWIVFLIYAFGLVSCKILGWRGRRMNILAVVAYITVVMATGAIHHFFPSFHDFKSIPSALQRTHPTDSALAIGGLPHQREGS